MSSRILIAQNDCASRSLLAGWLGGAGYVCEPATIQTAMSAADIHTPDAALVSVDGAMGHTMNVASALANRPGGTAVIVVSPPDLGIALAASRAGAVDCLPWPTSEDGVLDAVGRAVRHREAASTERHLVAALETEIDRAADALAALVAGAGARDAQVRLLEMLAACSRETYDHAERVATATARLCRALGVPAREAADTRRAALLHDVGMLALPARLSGSTASLSDAGIQAYRMHVPIGASLLSAVPSLAGAAGIVAATRERFDGSGYPARLRGTGIPPGARIVAVADAYDLLTSMRPCGEPSTHDEANLELARLAGSQLDPDVVGAWIRLSGSLRCF